MRRAYHPSPGRILKGGHASLCPPYDPQQALLALVDLDVIATRRAGIELARAADLLVRILDHLAPLADPADGARDREQNGEHRGRETHRLQRDPRIEVYIRIELAFDEIFVV